MAIDTADKLVAAFNAQQRKEFKLLTVATGTSTFQSLWTVGDIPPAGSAAGSAAGVVPTSSTTGAFPFTTSGQSYILGGTVSSSSVGKLILYDRLWHNSGLSGTVTVDTTIGTATALTRPDASGTDTELWMEIYSAIGNTAATLTVKYINSVGTTAQTATLVKGSGAAFGIAGRMYPITLAAGDDGVQAISSYSWHTTTGTAGDFGFTILRRICDFSNITTFTSPINDYASLGMPRIYDNACLAFINSCGASSTGNMFGQFIIGQG